MSMGANSATKCLRILDNIETILAIELMNASQALTFRKPKQSSPFIESFVSSFREVSPFMEEDRLMSNDIQASISFLKSFSIDDELLFG